MAEVQGGKVHLRPSKSTDKVRYRLNESTGEPHSVVPPHAMRSLLAIASGAPAGGCFVEVGVYQGGTAFHLAKIAQEQDRKIYLYDTFEGIPYQNVEKGDGHKVGDFDDTSFEQVVEVIPYAFVTKGLFPDSIIPMPPIAFAHIDVDQYDAVINSVRAIEGMMMRGGIILFDDYGCLKGATNAVTELYDEERIEVTEAGKALVRY